MNISVETILSKDQSTCLKAIAIICVFVSHVSGYYTRIGTPLGGIGVCIFLMLSSYGLILSVNKNGLTRYWNKRIVSVWMPYAILETLVVLLNGGMAFKDYLLDITFIRPKFVLGWYLNYLLFCYIYFFLIERFAKSIRIKTILYFVVSVTLFIYYLYTKDGLRFEQSFSFIIGIVIARYDVSKFLRPRAIWINLGLGVILLAIKQISFFRNIQVCYDILNLLLKIFISIAIIVFVYIYWNDLFCKYNLQTILIPIGKSSYIIYLVHGYLLILFDVLKGYSDILIVLTFFICCIIGTLIYSYFIKRMQCILIGKKGN